MLQVPRSHPDRTLWMSGGTPIEQRQLEELAVRKVLGRARIAFWSGWYGFRQFQVVFSLRNCDWPISWYFVEMYFGLCLRVC